MVPVFAVELVKLIDEILALQANQHEGMSNNGGSMGTKWWQTEHDSNQKTRTRLSMQEDAYLCHDSTCTDSILLLSAWLQHEQRRTMTPTHGSHIRCRGYAWRSASLQSGVGHQNCRKIRKYVFILSSKSAS